MATKNIKVKVNVENNFVIDKTEEKKLCKILVSKGEKGQDGTVSFDELTEEQRASLKGEDGKGVPSGGKVGQILAKTSDDDYQAEWIDNNAEVDLTEYAKKEELPTKVSDLENDKNFIENNKPYISLYGKVHVFNNFDNNSDRVDLSVGNLHGAESGGSRGTLYLNRKSDKDVRILEGGTGTLYYKGNEVADRYYVDEKISEIEISGGVDLSDYATKEELENKTNTTILPNDGGDIKTRFRISNKAEDESPVIYFPLVKLPQDNSKNSASVILRGRVGGFLSKDMAMINALIWNRTTTGISLFNINADTYTLEEPLRLCDIVVYTNEDTTDTIYLKCREWYVFDIDLEVHQSTAEILYDGTYLTEEPTGTLSATASTSDKRVEIYDGKLYLNGTELTGGSGEATGSSDYELPIASSSTLGGVKIGANLTIDDEGVLSAVGGSGEISGEITGEVLPIGTMIPFGSDKNIPSNWRICDGSEVSRSTYADLFNVIGTSYGEGDGETTFNLPNKQGRVSVGLATTQNEFNEIGKKGGSKYLQEHNHINTGFEGRIANWSYGTGKDRWKLTTSTSESGYTIAGLDSAGVGDSENLQPYEVDVWIIKTSNIIGNIEKVDGTIIDNLTSTSSTDCLSANMGRELNEKLEELSGASSSTRYSTEEQRIGTWIDGKPLYQKVIEIGAVSTTEVTTTTGVSNIEQVIDIKGGGTMIAGQFLKWGFENPAGYCSCYFDLARNVVVSMVSTTSYNLKWGYAILEYTKLTD